MSVPVFGSDGAIVLALTAIGASNRLDTSESGRSLTGLRDCAATVTQRLRSGAAPASTSP
jgi:DNA-binding IclR family transcriptional regulator